MLNDHAGVVPLEGFAGYADDSGVELHGAGCCAEGED